MQFCCAVCYYSFIIRNCWILSLDLLSHQSFSYHLLYEQIIYAYPNYPLGAVPIFVTDRYLEFILGSDSLPNKCLECFDRWPSFKVVRVFNLASSQRHFVHMLTSKWDCQSKFLPVSVKIEKLFTLLVVWHVICLLELKVTVFVLWTTH